MQNNTESSLLFGSRFMGSVRRLHQHLMKRQDSEHEQAILRLIIVLIIFLYFFSPFAGSDTGTGTAHLRTKLIGTLFLAYSVAVLVAIVVSPGKSVVRRIISIVVDLGTVSLVLAISGKAAAPLFAIYLWVTMGNGFRYGPNYLYIATLVSIAGFSMAMLVNDYWRSNSIISMSLLIGLVVLPIYMAVLLKKLHEAIQQANQASEAKSRFIAHMSHELRTPLNGVIGMSDLLKDTKLDDEQKELVRATHASANILLGLIENVLDISKIEAGKIAIEDGPIDLHTLVNGSVLMLEPQGRRKGLVVSSNISPETPFRLNGDALHLRQILINLIGNAIKFTHEGSVTVKVMLAGGTSYRPRIRFEVTDTGIGIPDERLEDIFEDFTQVKHAANCGYGGTGLGTTIARQLVELMGGEIGVTSSLGVGTCFWFEVPFTAQKSDVTSESALSALSDTRVLLLFNESDVAPIRSVLHDWGIEFDWVVSPARAFSMMIDACEHGMPYGIAIVEDGILEMGAAHFAGAVRADEALENLSLVLVDNGSAGGLDSGGLAGHYSSILNTPIDKTLLFNAIHAARSGHEPDENVVSLAEHYQRQTSARQLRILVAEDNAINQEVVTAILEHAGNEVWMASDGEQALDMLERSDLKFDLLLLDMNMPGRNGIDVLKALRFMDTGISIPVIMFTADATLEAKELCMASGADDYVTKPVDARNLLEKIALHSQRYRRLPEKKSEATVAGIHNQNDGILNLQALNKLAKLGTGKEFIRDLVEGFRRDGEVLLKELNAASEAQDYMRFREALHALKGGATELGGVELVTLCEASERLRPYDMGSTEPANKVVEISNGFNRIAEAMASYLTQQRELK